VVAVRQLGRERLTQVIREREDEQAVGAGQARLARGPEGLGRERGPEAGDDRDAGAGQLLLVDPDDAQPLLQRWGPSPVSTLTATARMPWVLIQRMYVRSAGSSISPPGVSGSTVAGMMPLRSIGVVIAVPSRSESLARNPESRHGPPKRAI